MYVCTLLKRLTLHGLSVDCDSLEGTQFCNVSNVDVAFTISVSV